MIGLKMPMPADCRKCPMALFIGRYKSSSTYDAQCCVSEGRHMDVPLGQRPEACPLVDLSAWEDDGK